MASFAFNSESVEALESFSKTFQELKFKLLARWSSADEGEFHFSGIDFEVASGLYRSSRAHCARGAQPVGSLTGVSATFAR